MTDAEVSDLLNNLSSCLRVLAVDIVLLRLSALIGGFILAAACVSSACAQNYPTRALRMLSAGAGGGSDVAARLIAQGLSESLGQPVVVDTRVGGVIIADIAAKAAPDGYTLMTYSSTLWLIPLMRPATTYDPLRDFAPITL